MSTGPQFTQSPKTVARGVLFTVMGAVLLIGGLANSGTIPWFVPLGGLLALVVGVLMLARFTVEARRALKHLPPSPGQWAPGAPTPPRPPLVLLAIGSAALLAAGLIALAILLFTGSLVGGLILGLPLAGVATMVLISTWWLWQARPTSNDRTAVVLQMLGGLGLVFTVFGLVTAIRGDASSGSVVNVGAVSVLLIAVGALQRTKQVRAFIEDAARLRLQHVRGGGAVDPPV